MAVVAAGRGPAGVVEPDHRRRGARRARQPGDQRAVRARRRPGGGREFTHSVALRTDEGLVCFDASGVHTGAAVVESSAGGRRPVHTLVYTHGHVDHVGGSGASPPMPSPRPRAAEGDRPRERPRPPRPLRADQRLEPDHQRPPVRRCPVRAEPRHRWPDGQRFLPADTLAPDETFGLDTWCRSATSASNCTTPGARPTTTCGPGYPTGGGDGRRLRHLGLPERRQPAEGPALPRRMGGRAPPDDRARARAARARPRLPIAGRERIATVLDAVATALEGLVADILAMMNAGATLDTIIHTVSVPADSSALPTCVPSTTSPSSSCATSGGCTAAGGTAPVTAEASTRRSPRRCAGRARRRARPAGRARGGSGRRRRLRLACHLVDLAGLAAPDDPVVHGARAEIYRARRKAEPSSDGEGDLPGAARETKRRSNGQRQRRRSERVVVRRVRPSPVRPTPAPCRRPASG